MNFIDKDNLRRTNTIVYDYTEYVPFEDEILGDGGVFGSSEIYLEAYDMDGDSLFHGTMTGEQFSETFGKSVTDILISNIRRGNTEGRIEDILFYDQKDISPDDVIDVNERAKTLFRTADVYYEDLRGYILVDGMILEFGDNRDHNSVCNIVDGMTVGKFISLGNIRIGKGSIELERKPTGEQVVVLKQMIRQYSDGDLYVDFCRYREGCSYATVFMGVQYNNPRADYVISEIDSYFDEGIIPIEAHVVESVGMLSKTLDKVLNESENISAVNESVLVDRLFNGCRTYDDYQKRVRLIVKSGIVSIGVLFGTISYITNLNNSEKRELKNTVLSTDTDGQKELLDDFVNDVENDSVKYASDFKASPDGISHIKSFEKLRLEPYYATPYEKSRGILTVGYGHKVTESEKDKFKLGTKITQEDADALFEKDLHQAERYVKHLIMNGGVLSTLRQADVYPQALMDVMVSMMFSGYGNFRNSTFYKRLCKCRRDPETGKIEKSDYDYTIASIPHSIVIQGGELSQGLKNRRNAEYEMVLK